MKVLSFDIGTKNLSYCIIDYKSVESYDILDWNVLDISTKSKKKNIYLLAENIITIFDTYDIFKSVDSVIIENQPCMKNPAMKSIQIIVFTYFMMHKKTTNIQNVILVSPKTKFNCYSGPEDIICVDHLKSAYSRRKKKAIICCNYIINNTATINKKWMEVFAKTKKKDDLADSFLLNLTYSFSTINS